MNKFSIYLYLNIIWILLVNYISTFLYISKYYIKTNAISAFENT